MGLSGASDWIALESLAVTIVQSSGGSTVLGETRQRARALLGHFGSTLSARGRTVGGPREGPTSQISVSQPNGERRSQLPNSQNLVSGAAHST
jgi:hypothetical protein